MTNVRATADRWWRVPRSRGTTTGGLLVLLGLWGGLATFIGPYLGYGFTPDAAWTFTWGRFWLEILPAAATILGGLAILGTANRVNGVWGAWLAVAGGAWFVLGGTFSRFWNGGVNQAGTATGGTLSQVAQEIGLFLGLGVVVLFLATIALTRFGLEPKRRMPKAAGHGEEAYPDEPERVRSTTDEPTAAQAEEERTGHARHEADSAP